MCSNSAVQPNVTWVKQTVQHGMLDGKPVSDESDQSVLAGVCIEMRGLPFSIALDNLAMIYWQRLSPALRAGDSGPRRGSDLSKYAEPCVMDTVNCSRLPRVCGLLQYKVALLLLGVNKTRARSDFHRHSFQLLSWSCCLDSFHSNLTFLFGCHLFLLIGGYDAMTAVSKFVGRAIADGL
ncbi:hypothetical protein RRG08_032067 [Elysia crispata]|uniref:Uncharacterized protein n=1 Tax=Elysia crispata TaxID=231223 RepID=A0AAE0ZHY4_9GAST|nr:hypothetical protein RRG08_032067 [Elysia crispata]